MADITAIITGIDEVFVQIDNASRRMSTNTRWAVNAAARQCRAIAKIRVPVSAGNYAHKHTVNGISFKAGHVHLRDVINMEKGSYSGVMIKEYHADVGVEDDGEHEYGLFVEHGTTKMSAQPFLFPSFLATIPVLERSLQGFITLDRGES